MQIIKKLPKQLKYDSTVSVKVLLYSPLIAIICLWLVCNILFILNVKFKLNKVMFPILLVLLYFVVSYIMDIVKWCIAKYDERKEKFEKKLKNLCEFGDIKELEALLKKGLDPNRVIITKEKYFNDYSFCGEYSPFEQEGYFRRSLLELCGRNEEKCALLRQYGAKA